ncbi:MAG: Holliday junction branch migration protein RuvA [Candidatus Babeliales bacterium]
MIDFIAGKIKKIEEKNVTILVNGIGFFVQMSQTKNLILNQNAEILIYMHWNQEKGPALYGFQAELEKTVFLMIIDCPKIGPGIASNILSQISAGEFLEIVSSQNEKALSKINGIGEKKAEQIIVHLKHKVSKLISSGKVQTQDLQQDFTMWQNVNDVLISLNYSKPEISKAMQYLTSKYSGQTAPLDQLIRSALGYLSGNL